MPKVNELILCPLLKAQKTPEGQLIMTQKYFEGAALLAEYWPGPITVMVELDDRPTDDMDRMPADPQGLGFKIEVIPRDQDDLVQRLEGAAVVLGFLSGKAERLEQACRASGVPLVCITEYSPKTERQIAAAELAGSPLRYLRRLLWLSGEERRRQRLLPRLSGLQCSGTPTHDLYAGRVEDALLFFDNRVFAEDVMTSEKAGAKFDRLKSGHPLRLTFGGRLLAMKGVDELPKVAVALRRLGIPFELTIVGSGPLERQIHQDIERADLSDCVTLLPPMDFRSGWVPFLRERTDIFLCSHVQGDPSSTYPEVMSCGVPILGFDNEAFSGILAWSDGGWAVPLRKPELMAEKLAELHVKRDDVLDKSRNAMKFAAEHAFEKTFARRTQQLRRLSRLDVDDVEQSQPGG